MTATTKYDMVIGGVGGQGILSIAFVIDNAAMKEGLHFKQAEVHGMAQRGGAVSSHLRLSDKPIYSDIVDSGAANLLLAMEPMEVLRYRPFLGPEGWVVTSTAPVENIPDYPEERALLDAVLDLPRVVLVDGMAVAREAGSHRAVNMVVLGAAAPFLPLSQEVMESFIEGLFARKGQKLVQTNIMAFRAGLAHGAFFRACREAGADPHAVVELARHLKGATVDPAAAGAWCEVLASPRLAELRALWAEDKTLRLAGDAATAAALLKDGVAAVSA